MEETNLMKNEDIGYPFNHAYPNRLNNSPLPRFTGINIYNFWFHWCFFCHPIWDDLKL